MRESIAIVGLGRIGLAVAKVLRSAGHDVCGFDIRPEPMDRLVSIGGTSALNPAEAAAQAQIVLVLVMDDAQVSTVITGPEGILKSIRKDGVIVCMSTINRSVLEALARQVDRRGIGFVDCPFTGGPGRATEGNLTLIAAGPEVHRRKVEPVLLKLGSIVLAGDQPGMGQAIKHCNQLLVSTTHAAVMEVILMAKKLGLDPELVVQVVSSGIAGSDYFRLLAKSVLKKNPSPGSLGQMCKDVAIVENTLEELGMNALVATAVSRYFSAATEMKMQDREGADLMEVVQKLSEHK